jgi:transposase-like protein
LPKKGVLPTIDASKDVRGETIAVNLSSTAGRKLAFPLTLKGSSMAIIFCQSKAYRDVSIWKIAELTEDEAHERFVDARWGSRYTVVCISCGDTGKHYYNRFRRVWHCKSCHAIFSVTSGTAFANRRLSYKKLLMAMFLFIAAPKSVAANKTHPELGVTLRTAYLLFGKIREALWEQRDAAPLQGVVHIDGGHFCGKPRRPRVRQRITSAAVNSRLRNRKASIVPPHKGQIIEPWNLVKLRASNKIVNLLSNRSSVLFCGEATWHANWLTMHYGKW